MAVAVGVDVAVEVDVGVEEGVGVFDGVGVRLLVADAVEVVVWVNVLVVDALGVGDVWVAVADDVAVLDGVSVVVGVSVLPLARANCGSGELDQVGLFPQPVNSHPVAVSSTPSPDAAADSVKRSGLLRESATRSDRVVPRATAPQRNVLELANRTLPLPSQISVQARLLSRTT